MEAEETTDSKSGHHVDHAGFFSGFEAAIVRCIRKAKGRSGYAAANAVTHLKKAWELRGLDSQMAAFRAITAEEEAATAILMKGRKNQGYMTIS